MALVASSSELSLIDLLQVKGQGRASCKISVMGQEHEGTIYVDAGEVVHATYGVLRGDDAARAMLGEGVLHYSATSDAVVPRPNMRASPTALALEAARIADEANRHVVPIVTARSARPTAAPAPPKPAAPAPRLRTAAAVGAIALLVLCGGAAAFVAWRRSAEPVVAPPTVSATAAPAIPVEASALRPPADSLPILVSGLPPRAPDPAAALRPTIVCRLLVGADGAVVRAEVYQRRPDLEASEEAALQAVRGYRFEPGRRAGVAVPVWVNWPVDFI